MKIIRLSALKILAVLLALSLPCCSSYKKILNIAFKTSLGVRDGGDVYFLLRYYMYRVPTGISMFPDGGTVRMIFDRYFLVREWGPGIKVVHEYDVSRFYRILFVSARLAMSGGNVCQVLR